MESLIYDGIFGKGKWWSVRHIAFWIFMYLDVFLSDILVPPEEPIGYFFTALSLILDLIVVYTNLYILIPRLLLKQKFQLYVVLTLMMLVVNVSIMMISESYHYDLPIYPEDWASSFIASLTLLMTAIAIKIGKYYYEQMQVTKELKLSQAQLEMNSLKQQINPHFLFNVLNTINIQSKTEPEQVSDTVVHLSDLLRYQIYEAGEQEKVLLQKEVDFLKNYIDLEQLRRDNLEVSWDIKEPVPRVKVNAFLFLPLIENALKHSRKIDGSLSKINVVWECNPESLSLIVTNTIGDVRSDEQGGFGIDNLKKRLHLLYPHKYDLSLSSKGDLYEAKLVINIS